MNRKFTISILALALVGAAGSAQATEDVLHNDMDGDGRSDLVWRNASTGAIVYWPNANANKAKNVTVGILRSDLTYDQRHTTSVFAVADPWETPRKAVLVVKDQTSGFEYGLYPSDYYLPTFNYVLGTYGYGVNSAAHGDFNADGETDVFYRNPKDGKNFFWLSAGLADWGAVYKAAPTVGIAWQVVDTGDFDGDGRSDILWRNATTGQNGIWRSGNSGTRLYVAKVSNLDWKVAAIGDFDGDRRSDILWRNARTGANVIWRSGNHLTAQSVAAVTSKAWKVVATGDFDGDGKWDLVWRNAGTGENVLWRSANRATRQTLPSVAREWSALM
ncbi:MAG TPA: VCBS repeat-containing protein [Lysobacter sp.]|nr:VCBS repeat-containing protein [Lysobacter sp.]